MLPKTVITYLVLQSHFANQQLQNMSEKEKNELREKFSSLAKGQKKLKAGSAHCMISQKTNKRICFVCCEKQKKQTK